MNRNFQKRKGFLQKLLEITFFALSQFFFLLKVKLLGEWRGLEEKGLEEAEPLLSELRQTIAAIAAGLRTTG